MQTASEWHRRIRLGCRQNRQVGASPLRKSSTSTARQHIVLARSSPWGHRGEELRAGRGTAQGSRTKALLAKACGSCLGVILFGRELSVGRHTLAPHAPADGGTICRIWEGTFVGETNYHSGWVTLRRFVARLTNRQCPVHSGPGRLQRVVREGRHCVRDPLRHCGQRPTWTASWVVRPVGRPSRNDPCGHDRAT